jgi:hypothetical protein
LARSADAKLRRLKVYKAVFGFHESVVAAPNQAAALRAWGVRQNLFAEGEASVEDDEAAVEAARAHPEIPLRRAVGSSDAFAVQPTALPEPPPSTRSSRAKPKARLDPPAKAKPPRPPADRSLLDAAEQALTALAQERKRGEEEFLRRQEALDLERDDAKRRWKSQRKSLERAADQARRAYREAGGKA